MISKASRFAVFAAVLAVAWAVSLFSPATAATISGAAMAAHGKASGAGTPIQSVEFRGGGGAFTGGGRRGAGRAGGGARRAARGGGRRGVRRAARGGRRGVRRGRRAGRRGFRGRRFARRGLYYGWPYYYSPYYYYGPRYNYSYGGGRCSYWRARCADNWGYGGADFYGCLRYHGCY